MPDYVFPKDVPEMHTVNGEGELAIIGKRMVRMKAPGNFSILDKQMRPITEVDDVVLYSDKSVETKVPIIFEATVSKNHCGVSANRKANLIYNMTGLRPFYVGVEMGTGGSTRIYSLGYDEKKIVVGSKVTPYIG
jgi:hypothetical protein